MKTRDSMDRMLLLTVAGAAYAGGWAIVTVNEFREHGVVGKTEPIAFTVRHGITLTNGLKAAAFARMAGMEKSLKIDAQPTANPGEYRFELTLTQAGDWTIAIDSGFLFQMVKEVPNDAPKSPQAGFVSVPLKVISADSTPPAISEK